jgi:hypothetical protein
VNGNAIHKRKYLAKGESFTTRCSRENKEQDEITKQWLNQNHD